MGVVRWFMVTAALVMHHHHPVNAKTCRLSAHLPTHMHTNTELNVKSVKSVIGGSFGGMQTLEYMCGFGGEFVRSGVPIACGAKHTAWQIGISETQRQCIYADPKWKNYNFDDPPFNGLEVARQIGMFSYRTAAGFDNKFGRKVEGKDGEGKVRVIFFRVMCIHRKA